MRLQCGSIAWTHPRVQDRVELQPCGIITQKLKEENDSLYTGWYSIIREKSHHSPYTGKHTHCNVQKGKVISSHWVQKLNSKVNRIYFFTSQNPNNLPSAHPWFITTSHIPDWITESHVRVKMTNCKMGCMEDNYCWKGKDEASMLLLIQRGGDVLFLFEKQVIEHMLVKWLLKYCQNLSSRVY